MILSNWKTIALFAAIAAAIWFYKDYEFQKVENARQTENNRQLRMADSVKFTTQILSKDEIQNYLETQNKDLKQNLNSIGVKLNRIESISSNSYRFSDDTLRSSDISNIVSAVRNNLPTKEAFQDSTKCMMIKGFVRYENNKMLVDITSREFTNKNDGVVYWERRQWKLLGIKTRLFGKKQFTSASFDQCGETKTLQIQKKQ